MRYLKDAFISNLASPIGLAAISYCMFLFAWSFPPGLYTFYIHEPDLMFLSVLPFVFATSCVITFIFGVRASRFFVGRSGTTYLGRIEVKNPLFYLCVPVLSAAAYCCMYLKILGGQIDVTSLLAAQDGNAIKIAGQAGQLGVGRWSASVLMLTGTLWWASYRANEVKLRGAQRTVFGGVRLLGIAVNVVACVATVDRTTLMPLVAGIAIVVLFGKTYIEEVRAFKLLVAALGAAAAVVTLFTVMSFLRGSSGISLVITGLLGYTIASYNRMAALLLGVMHDSYEGQGALLFPMLRSGYFDTWFHFSNLFSWPSGFNLWFSSINSVRSAGLSSAFNYYSVFGALYTDLGWGTVIYLFVIGIFTGSLWLQFRRGKTYALILYPWCAFCILFWVGFNVMFDSRLLDLIKAILLLSAYDRFTLRYPAERKLVVNNQDRNNLFATHAVSGLSRGFF